MTVQKDVTKNIYVGNGSTRTFPFTFECPAEHPEYIKVYLMQNDGTALATSDYQLDMDAKQITYPSSGTALPEGKKLVIMRELPLQQMMNLVNNGPYFAEDIETAFDECVMAMQQIAEKLNRSIIMSVDIDGDAFVNEVPFEAGKSFRIADDGKSIVLTEDPAKVLPLVQGVYAQTQTQAQNAIASAAAAAKSENSTKAYMDTTKDLSENVNVFIPSADADGTLTWTNKAGLDNPATVNIKGEQGIQGATGPQGERGPQGLQGPQGEKGDKGEKGDQGTGVTIKGKYDSLSALQAAHPKGNDGDAYMVGTSLYAWTGSAWVDCGNIQGPKGDRGDTGPQGATGPQGPKGDKGDGADITVDAELSATSTNPVQNKAVKTAIDNVTASIPTKVSKLENDISYARTSAENIWTNSQSFHNIGIKFEKYAFKTVTEASDMPTTSTAIYNVTDNNYFTLDLGALFAPLMPGESTVFTSVILASADCALNIINAGTIMYVGSASDISISSTGTLLNMYMLLTEDNERECIVQASKLEGGA